MDFKVVEFPKPYERFNRPDLDYIEYPSHEALFNGIPMNTCYVYVSHVYLNGFVNYCKHRDLFLNFIYETEPKKIDEIKDKIADIDEHKWIHSNLGQLGDNVTLIGEIDDSYLIFDYDCDVSDCCIMRLSKEDYSYEDVRKYAIQFMEDNNPLHDVDFYLELPLPNGWCHF